MGQCYSSEQARADQEVQSGALHENPAFAAPTEKSVAKHSVGYRDDRTTASSLIRAGTAISGVSAPPPGCISPEASRSPSSEGGVSKQIAEQRETVSSLREELERKDQRLAALEERLCILEQRAGQEATGSSTPTQEKASTTDVDAAARMARLEGANEALTQQLAALDATWHAALLRSVAETVNKELADLPALQPASTSSVSNLDLHVMEGIQAVLKAHMGQVMRMAQDCNKRLDKIGSEVASSRSGLYSDIGQVLWRVNMLEQQLHHVGVLRGQPPGSPTGPATPLAAEPPATLTSSS